MPRLVKTVLQYTISLGIAGLLLWLIFRKENPYELWNNILNADLSWIAASFAVSLLSHFLRAYRWNILMQPLGHSPSVKNSFLAVMVGYAVNIGIPRGGEVSRCAMLKKTDNIPVNESFGTVVTERIFDLLMLMICIMLAFLVQFDLLKDFVFSSVQKSIGTVELSTAKIIIGISGFLVAAIAGYTLYRFLYKKFRSNPFFQKLLTFKNGLIEGLFSFRKIRKKWQFLASTIIIWVGYFYMSYLMFFSLEGTSHLGLDAGLAILVLGGMGMALPVPGGAGTFHGFVSYGLFSLFLIPQEIGKTYAIIVHSSQMFLLILVGFACFLIILFISKKKNTNVKIVSGNLAKNNAA